MRKSGVTEWWSDKGGNEPMKNSIGALLLCALFLIADSSVLAHEPLQLYDISNRKVETLDSIVYRLSESRIVLVGEHHREPSHHEAQLQIIRSLAESGIPVAVGLEMFRSDSQEALDRWVEGKMPEKEFQKNYQNNWNFPWPLYRDIFNYSREKRVPLVGLNVPRAITRQVAREGFRSLTPEQKGLLPFIECKVDPEYMEFIKRAHGAHAHGGLNFEYFCEAQLVWDKAMAVHAIEYLNARPGLTMVLLAGTAHVWKKAIPAHLEQFSFVPYTAILPEVPGSIERSGVTVEDADYLILGLPASN
jgi:uncharacterized iron-regulated protein